MSEKDYKDIDPHRLDKIANKLLKKSGLKASDLAAIDASPFLKTRLRASIEERLAIKNDEGFWSGLLLVARWAVPIIILLVLATASAPTLSSTPSAAQGLSAKDTVSITPNYEIRSENTASCSLSSKQDCSITNTDMLVTIFPNE